MSTSLIKRTYKLSLTFEEIVKLIKIFSIEDKIRLEKELEKETLLYRAKKLSKKIKPNDLTMVDVITEVSGYRKEKE